MGRFSSARIPMLNNEYSPMASFHVSRSSQGSFTLDTKHNWAKIVGYVLAGMIAGMICYLGYKLYEGLPDLFVHYTTNLEKKIDESFGE